MNVEVHLSFFYKQPVYKQLALRWQIGKQLSGLNPFPLSNRKTTDERKVELFLFSKRKVAVKLAVHHNSAISNASLGTFCQNIGTALVTNHLENVYFTELQELSFTCAL